MASKKEFVDLVKRLESEGNHWYIWGAQGPNNFDCSGLVCWCGSQVGLWDKSFDTTANGFWHTYAHVGKDPADAEPGDLALYGRSKATHVVIYMGGHKIIGANGGGSKTTSIEKARAANAKVSKKDYTWRRDFLGFVRLPFDKNTTPSTDRFPMYEGGDPVKFCFKKKWIVGDGNGHFVNVPLTISMANTVLGRAELASITPATSDPREMLSRKALQEWISANFAASGINILSDGRDPKENLRLISLCYVLFWLKGS